MLYAAGSDLSMVKAMVSRASREDAGSTYLVAWSWVVVKARYQRLGMFCSKFQLIAPSGNVAGAVRLEAEVASGWLVGQMELHLDAAWDAEIANFLNSGTCMYRYLCT